MCLQFLRCKGQQFSSHRNEVWLPGHGRISDDFGASQCDRHRFNKWCFDPLCQSVSFCGHFWRTWNGRSTWPKRTCAAGELVVTDRVAAAQEPTFQYREGPERLEGDVHDSEEKNGNFQLISDFMGFHWVLDESWKFILSLGLYLVLFWSRNMFQGKASEVIQWYWLVHPWHLKVVFTKFCLRPKLCGEEVWVCGFVVSQSKITRLWFTVYHAWTPDVAPGLLSRWVESKREEVFAW